MRLAPSGDDQEGNDLSEDRNSNGEREGPRTKRHEGFEGSKTRHGGFSWNLVDGHRRLSDASMTRVPTPCMDGMPLTRP